jgi:predicted RNA-binding Zn-ribbon protein involved in translation (DUF1610 family)
MSYEARWIGTCPACGPVEIVASEARLRLLGTEASVEFRCPACGASGEQLVDQPTAEMFQALGAEVVVVSAAVEPVEPAEPAEPAP